MMRFLLNVSRSRKKLIVFMTILGTVWYFGFRPSHYEEQEHNLVYVKMFKCASETLSSVFSRYGLLRSLNFVLPISNKLYLGWPYKLNQSFYRHKISDEFNMLVDHAMYNRQYMDNMMPRGTKYVTSLRHPYSQFKSLFHYFNLKNILQLHHNALQTYMENIDKLDARYKEPSSATLRFCIPDGISMTKNVAAFTLGFPMGFPAGTSDKTDDETFVNNFVNKMATEFDLVIITEYFDESMILLKHLMKWRFSDILYHPKNVARYDYKNDESKELIRIHKSWSKIDYKLYDKFNQTLWTKIKAMPHFDQEVKHYKKLLQDFKRFCVEDDNMQFVVSGGGFEPDRNLDKDYCRLVGARLFKDLKEIYDSHPNAVQTPLSKIVYC